MKTLQQISEMMQRIRKCDITYPAFSILNELGSQGKLSNREVGENLSMPSGSIKHHMNDLLQNNWVEKSLNYDGKGWATDRTFYEITDRGIKTLAYIIEPLAEERGAA